MLAPELYELAKTIKPYDVVMEHRTMRNPHTRKMETQCRTFRVASVDVTPERVAITYRSCRRPDSVQCTFGCLFLQPVENGNHSHEKWGTQTLEVVGKEMPPALARGNGWMVRHPGYDLMY